MKSFKAVIMKTWHREHYTALYIGRGNGAGVTYIRMEITALSLKYGITLFPEGISDYGSTIFVTAVSFSWSNMTDGPNERPIYWDRGLIDSG